MFAPDLTNSLFHEFVAPRLGRLFSAFSSTDFDLELLRTFRDWQCWLISFLGDIAQLVQVEYQQMLEETVFHIYRLLRETIKDIEYALHLAHHKGEGFSSHSVNSAEVTRRNQTLEMKGAWVFLPLMAAVMRRPTSTRGSLPPAVPEDGNRETRWVIASERIDFLTFLFLQCDAEIKIDNRYRLLSSAKMQEFLSLLSHLVRDGNTQEWLMRLLWLRNDHSQLLEDLREETDDRLAGLCSSIMDHLTSKQMEENSGSPDSENEKFSSFVHRFVFLMYVAIGKAWSYTL